MGIYLSDNGHDCLTNMRFADDVLLFAISKEQLQKMLCEFKNSTEKVGLRIHPGKTKILSNQSSDTRKDIETDDIKSRNTDKRRKHEILGPNDNFPATGDDRNPKSDHGHPGPPSTEYRLELTIRALVERCAPCDFLRQYPSVPDSQVRSHSSVSFVFCSTLIFSSRTFACFPLSGYAGDGSLLRSNRGAGIVFLLAIFSQHSGKCTCEFRVPWHSRFFSGVLSGVLAGFLVVSCGALAGNMPSEFSPNAFRVFLVGFSCGSVGFIFALLRDSLVFLQDFLQTHSFRLSAPRVSGCVSQENPVATAEMQTCQLLPCILFERDPAVPDADAMRSRVVLPAASGPHVAMRTSLLSFS